METTQGNKGWGEVDFTKYGRLVLLIGILFCIAPFAQAQLSGHVYRDFNGDGLRQQNAPSEPGLGGVAVSAFVAGSSTPLSTTTDSLGFYSLAVPAGQKVRLEFSGLPFQTYVHMAATGTGSSVQFATAPASGVDLAVGDPLQYCHTPVPSLVVPTYVVGDALATGSNSSSLPAIVKFPYGASGQADVSNPLTDAGTVGTVWGSAYHRQAEKLFYSAFLKRHSSLGALGLGGIYKIDPSGFVPAEPYLDLRKFVRLSSAADSIRLLGRNLPDNLNEPAVDSAAFSLVGKVGLGGMALSPDEQTLWVINLYEKTLVKVAIGAPVKPGNQLTGADIVSFPIPNPGCVGGAPRPWALQYHEGSLYVGLTCDAGEPGSTRDNLRAYVYRFDLATMQFISSPVISEPLNYRKGWVHALVPQSEYWEPWSDTWGDFTTSLLTTENGVDIYRVSRPQPIFSDIEFDTDGSILLGLMDRTGHQTGRNQPAVPADANLYSGYIGGDILRAQAYANGTFRLEKNGVSGLRTGSGAGNGEGPGGGEFYGADLYRDPISNDTIQQETFMGAMLSLPGNNEVIATVIEPFAAWSGGAAWFSNQNGQRTKAYEVYFGDDPSEPQYLGNANGLGSFATLCTAAPLQIGNRLWVDANKDGIQNPDEAPLANVYVALYDKNGTLVTFTQTNATGNYLFQGSYLTPYTTYYIVPGTNGTTPQFNAASSVLEVDGAFYKLTVANRGEGAQPDLNDSDAQIASGLPAALNGLPVIQIQTGAPGQNTPNYDAGFIDCWMTDVPDAEVCEGTAIFQFNVAATPGQAWLAMPGNPSGATIDASGQVSGLGAPGTYRFVLRQSETCADTVSLIVKPRPRVQAVVETVTCTNFVSNNDGKITLTGFTAQEMVDYSLGATFSSPVYGSPQSIPANGIVVNDLENPTVATQLYTVRITNQNGCEQDLTLTLKQRDCACEGVSTVCQPVTFRVFKNP